MILLPGLLMIVTAAGTAATVECEMVLSGGPGGGIPQIGEVQKAAARHAGFDLERASAWKKKAPNAAWLPELKVRVKRENFSNDGEKYNTDTPYELLTFSDGIFFEISAQWSLEKLVFRREEVEAARENAALFESYRRLMEEVGRHYFKHRQIAGELELKAAAEEKGVEMRLQALEAAAMLDALTGGFFSGRICGGRDGGGGLKKGGK